jgi:hypothetical protein
VFTFYGTNDSLLSLTTSHILKGQYHEIAVSGFFIKQLLLVSKGMSRNDFDFVNIRKAIRIFNWPLGVEYTRESIRTPSARQFFQT